MQNDVEEVEEKILGTIMVFLMTSQQQSHKINEERTQFERQNIPEGTLNENLT